MIDFRQYFEECGAIFRNLSGSNGNIDVQCAKIFTDPAKAEEVCIALADQVKEKFKGQTIDYIVSNTETSVILGYELAKHLKLPNIFCERVDGKLKLSAGSQLKKGSRVLVVEDVLTSDQYSHEIYEVVKSYDTYIIGEACLIDKTKEGGEKSTGLPVVSLVDLSLTTYTSDSITTKQIVGGDPAHLEDMTNDIPIEALINLNIPLFLNLLSKGDVDKIKEMNEYLKYAGPKTLTDLKGLVEKINASGIKDIQTDEKGNITYAKTSAEGHEEKFKVPLQTQNGKITVENLIKIAGVEGKNTPESTLANKDGKEVVNHQVIAKEATTSSTKIEVGAGKTQILENTAPITTNIKEQPIAKELPTTKIEQPNVAENKAEQPSAANKPDQPAIAENKPEQSTASKVDQPIPASKPEPSTTTTNKPQDMASSSLKNTQTSQAPDHNTSNSQFTSSAPAASTNNINSYQPNTNSPAPAQSPPSAPSSYADLIQQHEMPSRAQVQSAPAQGNQSDMPPMAPLQFPPMAPRQVSTTSANPAAGNLAPPTVSAVRGPAQNNQID